MQEASNIIFFFRNAGSIWPIILHKKHPTLYWSYVFHSSRADSIAADCRTVCFLKAWLFSWLSG